MIYKGFILIISILLATACSHTAPKPQPTAAQLADSKGYQLGDPVKSILNYKLDGWNKVSSQALIIHSSPKHKYLVTLRDRCHELSTREVIGTTATGNAMRAGFDAIIVSLDGARGGLKSNTRKCYIDEIYRISKVDKTSGE